MFYRSSPTWRSIECVALHTAISSSFRKINQCINLEGEIMFGNVKFYCCQISPKEMKRLIWIWMKTSILNFFDFSRKVYYHCFQTFCLCNVIMFMVKGFYCQGLFFYYFKFQISICEKVFICFCCSLSKYGS